MARKNGDGLDYDSTGESQSQRAAIDLTKDNDDTEASLIDLTVSDEDDEELKLAIALSLQDQQAVQVPSSTTTTPALVSQLSSSAAPERNPQSQLGEHQKLSLGGAVLVVPGLDRKQMEAERLARSKRKREPTTTDRAISPPPLRRNMDLDRPPTQAFVPSRTKASIGQNQFSSNASAIANSPKKLSTRPYLQYSEGKVLLTSLDKSQNQSISLPELLKPTEPNVPLKSALLSTFIVNFDWLLPHFDTRSVSFVLALHARGDQEKSQLKENFRDISNVRLIFPYIGGNVNCMHSKVMLLFYENPAKNSTQTRCRVVVPSSNLVPWDWGVGAVMENILFVIDLPLRDESAETHEQNTNFKCSLVQKLEAWGTPDNVIQKLDKFDFSKTAPYGFVHTIGGSHVLSKLSKPTAIKNFFSTRAGGNATPAPGSTLVPRTRTGIISLSDTVRSMGLTISPDEASYPPRLDFITSSLGNLKAPFLQSLFLAACGRAPELPPKSSKAARMSETQTGEAADQKSPETAVFTKNLKVYFPSDETVRHSRGGPNSAGTICFQSKWWDGPGSEFPKETLSDCVGVRQDRILMHSKILFVRFAKPKDAWPAEGLHGCERHGSASCQPNETVVPSTTHSKAAKSVYAGWAYIGSANLSESAWGSLVTDSKTKQPKLSCRNWEGGVLVPVPLKPEHEGKNLHDLTLQEVFGDIVPVPMEYPGVNMVESGRRPWFFNA